MASFIIQFTMCLWLCRFVEKSHFADESEKILFHFIFGRCSLFKNKYVENWIYGSFITKMLRFLGIIFMRYVETPAVILPKLRPRGCTQCFFFSFFLSFPLECLQPVCKMALSVTTTATNTFLRFFFLLSSRTDDWVVSRYVCSCCFFFFPFRTWLLCKQK